MAGGYKVGGALAKGAGLAAYQDMVIGSRSYWRLVKYELIMLLCQNRAGALGLVLRKKLFPMLLGACGKGCLFGRGVTLRHPGKIRLGAGVVIDDNAMLDAKGSDNQGIDLADGVYIGRNTIVYTKNGDIRLAEKANISHNCELFSSNLLTIGPGSFVAAYSYLLSGGEYAIDGDTPLIDQDGSTDKPPTRVGGNTWVAAHCIVSDGSRVGDDTVIAANSMVRGDIPAGVLAGGTPAKVIRPRRKSDA